MAYLPDTSLYACRYINYIPPGGRGRMNHTPDNFRGILRHGTACQSVLPVWLLSLPTVVHHLSVCLVPVFVCVCPPVCPCVTVRMQLLLIKNADCPSFPPRYAYKGVCLPVSSLCVDVFKRSAIVSSCLCPSCRVCLCFRLAPNNNKYWSSTNKKQITSLLCIQPLANRPTNKGNHRLYYQYEVLPRTRPHARIHMRARTRV